MREARVRIDRRRLVCEGLAPGRERRDLVLGLQRVDGFVVRAVPSAYVRPRITM